MAQILENLSVDSLAVKLGLSKTALIDLAKDVPRLYYEVSIPKKDGSERKLEIPLPILKKLQKRLLDRIIHKIPTHPKLYGRSGTSTKKAVKEHVKKETVITMDITNFFLSTKSAFVKNMLIENGSRDDVAKLLTRLVTHKKHLPQGAPTSPCVARLMLQGFAEGLEKFLKQIPYSAFSIYVDDITISGPKGIKHAKSIVKKILKRYGYDINESKTKIMNQTEEQISLNIRLNERIEATTQFLKEIEELEKEVPPYDAQLLGKKSYIKYLMK